MKFRFSDIDNSTLYDTGYIIYVTGPYPVFNNIVVDRVREDCKGDIQDISEGDIDSFMGEFTVSQHQDKSNNSLSFDEFMDVVKVPPVTGKWFCHVDYGFMTKKQKDMLSRYYKKPNENGVLVVSIAEWMDYKEHLRNRAITQNPNTHIIQLSFPDRIKLRNIISDLFNDNGVIVADRAIDLFIMRMSSSYNEYQEVIDKICYNMGFKGNIDYSAMVENLKGIDNYVLDDFIWQLTKPIKSKKVVKRRKIYKMANALIQDMGARSIVNKIKYRLDDIIEMRININNGNVPVMVRYSIGQVKGRIGEENRLNKLSDYSFKRCAYLANQTSLTDWYYMKLILGNVKPNMGDSNYEKALLALIHRSTMSTDRLMNNIGIKNTLEEGLVDLNKVLYNPYVYIKPTFDENDEYDGDDYFVDKHTGELLFNRREFYEKQ